MRVPTPALLGICVALAGAGVSVAHALSAYAPPRMRDAILYMKAQKISRACIVLRARAGASTKAEVVETTGDAVLDAKIVRGFVLEVDMHKRMKLADFSRDARGGFLVPLDFDAEDLGGERVLGCGGA